MVRVERCGAIMPHNWYPSRMAQMDESEPIRITVDRDSVAMGDDVESHVQFWEMPASATVDDLLVTMARTFLVPMASWSVYRDIHDDSRRTLLGLI